MVIINMRWDEETYKVRKEYEDIYREKPVGINYDEYDSIEEYREYLKSLIDLAKEV